MAGNRGRRCEKLQFDRKFCVFYAVKEKVNFKFYVDSVESYLTSTGNIVNHNYSILDKYIHCICFVPMSYYSRNAKTNAV